MGVHEKTKVELKNGRLVVTTYNDLLLPLAVVEAVVIGSLMAINYFVRFDTGTRYDYDMSDEGKILLSCDPLKLNFEWVWPYYDYTDDSKLQEGLVLNYRLAEWVFFLNALLVPIGIFAIVEGWYGFVPPKRYKEVVIFGKYALPQAVRRFFRISGVYLMGGCIAGIFVSVLKFNITSPRPHFMSVCQNQTAYKSEWNVCFSGDTLWNPEKRCSKGTTSEELLEAMKSYPSYHAAIAVYSGVFTSAYTFMVARTRAIYNFRPLVILGLMVMAFLGATHRLATGHSFPRDVISGTFIGIVVAVFVVKVSLNNFRERIWGRKLRLSSLENDKLLPIKKLYSPKQVNQYNANNEVNDSSESDEDYRRISSNIDTFPIIPRVAPQAMQTASTGSPAPPLYPKPKSIPPPLAKRVSASPVVAASSSVREGISAYHSSLPRHNPWTTEASGQEYNIPRQRLSAPYYGSTPKDSQTGYDGPFLSAYDHPDSTKEKDLHDIVF